MEEGEVYSVKKEQFKQASMVLSDAFFEDPIWKGLIPDNERRKLFMPEMNEFLLHVGLKVGRVFASSDQLEGVAVWFPAKTANMGFRHIFFNGLFPMIMKIYKKYKKEMMHMMKSLKIIEKDRVRIMKGQNYLYLAVIGVSPKHQGKGNSSKILKGLFEESRRLQVPVYLETETENNVEMYKHLGFSVFNERDFEDYGFYVWQMIRQPEQGI